MAPRFWPAAATPVGFTERCNTGRLKEKRNETGAVVTFRATLKPPLAIGAGPIGARMYFELSGGEVVGARLRGAIRGGGEWALIGPDGFLRP